MNKKLANWILALALVSVSASSCGLFDPYDPYDPGGNGGRDTNIWDPGDTLICDDPRDTNVWDPGDSNIWDDPRDTTIWNPWDTIVWDPRDTSGNGWGRDTVGNDDRGDDNGITFVKSEGTVVWVPIEGGFWGIEAVNGHEYEPINLPREFQVNGLKVAFQGQVMHNWGSMYMWGEVLDVGTIHRVR